MVAITTATLTVASGNKQLETLEAGHDSILYSDVIRYEQMKSLALTMGPKYAIIK